MDTKMTFKVGDKVRRKTIDQNLYGWKYKDTVYEVHNIFSSGGHATLELLGIPDTWDASRFELVTPKTSSPVVSPDHYNSGPIECIDAIEASMSRDEFLGYLKGNTMKYLWRYGYKGKPEEDLNKAEWYLDKLTTTYSKGVNSNV